ncbi:hypothetical protein C9374_010812 [Naegleria lovaniensis]|uniref:Arf-GAP domain-containing protein n=1 Tax=Naegleria lovaniensis TaxID=51637 RepID=A0AA88GG29_NAELO|nr:uncharacterized protein C9374_010812 [Naegleria lovaniensis]KAG2374528.1 hypothetical protein C9374_010812 [Naegleria lovaniensis]
MSSKQSSSDNASPSPQDLLKLSKIPGNESCADCQVPKPQWVDVAQGVFICIQCAGIRRSNISVTICRVKSLNLDRWNQAEYQHVSSLGNLIVNRRLEAKLDSETKSQFVHSGNSKLMETFIVSKYVHRVWAQDDRNTKSEHDEDPIMSDDRDHIITTRDQMITPSGHHHQPMINFLHY